MELFFNYRSSHIYFSTPVHSQVPRTWNPKFLENGLFLSLLSVIFGFLTPKNLPIPNFKMKGFNMVDFTPEHPFQSSFQILNNFGIINKFSGIDHFNTIYKLWKNEQNLRGVSTSKNIEWFDMQLPLGQFLHAGCNNFWLHH